MLPPGAEAWGAAEAALVLLRADVEQAAGDAVARRQPWVRASASRWQQTAASSCCMAQFDSKRAET